MEQVEDRLCLSGFGLTEAAGSPFAVGNGPSSFAAGDYNGDGRLDLATANRSSNDVSVLLGNGAGGFAEATGSPFLVDDLPVSVAVGDFNGDGDLDLATANLASDNVSVLLGNGAGAFATATGSPFPVGNSPNSILVADFNEDGHLDLTTANTDGDDVSVLLGNGAGGFAEAAGSPFAVGDAARSVAVGDLNGDGHLDLTTANLFSDNASVLLGNGAGGFGEATGSPFAVGDSPESIAVGDFNEDGQLDVATANIASDDVSVLLGDGVGGFAEAAGSPFAAGDGPLSVTVGDLNGDGFLDLTTANIGSDDVSVLLGNGAGGFAEAAMSPFAVGDGPLSVAVEDLNGDGSLDLATANVNSDDVTVLLNTLVGISIDDVVILEGDEGVTNAVFTVSLSRPSDLEVTLDYVTLGDSATAGVDYQNAFGSLTFQPGQTSRFIVVPIFGDLVKEGDETFTVKIGNPSSGVIVKSEGQALLVNDDALATVQSVVINNGEEQRSMVTNVTVSFNSEVTLQAGAFELTNGDGLSFAVDVSASLIDGKTVAELTFGGGSLPDGNYTLTIVAANVLDHLGKSLDGDDDRLNGGDHLTSFHRLFGDSDGDGDVDKIDRDLFSRSYGTEEGHPFYLAFFDFDGDGDIDNADRKEFNARFNSKK